MVPDLLQTYTRYITDTKESNSPLKRPDEPSAGQEWLLQLKKDQGLSGVF